MVYADWYEKISRPFRAPGLVRALGVLDRAMVYGFLCAYVTMIVVLAVHHDPRIVKALAVPVATFAIVTLARMAVSKPRPYEAHPIDPLIRKDTVGKSMPSRHMASSAIIACTCLWIWPLPGVILVACCCVIAFTRIVGGVHYPADIVVAIAISVAFAVIGFLVIP